MAEETLACPDCREVVALTTWLDLARGAAGPGRAGVTCPGCGAGLSLGLDRNRADLGRAGGPPGPEVAVQGLKVTARPGRLRVMLRARVWQVRVAEPEPADRVEGAGGAEGGDDPAS